MQKFPFSLWEVLASLGTFGAFIIAYLQYRGSIVNTPDYKAAKANSIIQNMLDNLVENIEGLEIATITAVSNGGGIPLEGRPLYMRALFCTDGETLGTWQDKFLMEGALVNVHSQMMLSGDVSFVKTQMKMRATVAWYETKELCQSHMFIIGLDPGKEVFALICNFNEQGVLPHAEYLAIRHTVQDIRKLFKRRRLFGWVKLPLKY